MANPVKYDPDYSFSNYQANNPSKPLPAPQLDNELANVATSIDQTIDALAEVRRSDGALVNRIVTPDSLSEAARAEFARLATGVSPATEAQAIAGEDATEYMSPLTARQAIEARAPYVFTVDPLDAVDLVGSLPTKKTIVVEGSVFLTEPVLYDDSRNDSWHGATDISNVIDGGTRVRYTGTGKSASITAATNANPAVFTSVGHSFVDGDVVFVIDAVGGTWGPALNGGPWVVANVSGDTFTLENVASTDLSGVSLGTLTDATIRTPGAMAAFHLTGSFGQSYRGLTFGATTSPEAVVWIGANDYLDTTDFSGSVTSFFGMQFRGGDVDLGKANVVVENHKFAAFESCWWTAGPTNTVGLHVGGKRDNNRRTLLEGAAYNTLVKSSFLFTDVVLENAEGFNIIGSQFDGFDNSAQLYMPAGGIASGVHIDTVLFSDHGNSAPGSAAIHQGPADQVNSILRPYTGGWAIDTSVIRDAPIGIRLEAGMARVSANQFRGRDSGDIGIVIGENARGEIIDASNDFSQMSRAGNIGIRDDRYKTVAITGATQANPVVLTFAAGHHFRNGDRIRVASVGGMTQINNKEFLVAGATATTLQLNSLTDAGGTSAAVDGTAYGAYTSGGTAMRPYMWHRESFGGVMMSVGHSDMVFDLALDQSAILAAGSTNLLNMFNVPIIGGHYEITYGSVVDMAGQSGAVKFDLTMGGLTYAESSFHPATATDDEISHFFQRRMYIPGISGTSGSTVRFRVNAPGVITLRGKTATTLGLTFCQMRRVA